VRRRLLTTTLFVVVLAVVTFAIPLAVVVRRTTINNELDELERVATRAERVVSVVSLRDGDSIPLPAAGHDIHLGVYDVTGRRVAGVGPARLDRALAAVHQGKVAEIRTARLAVAVPVDADGRIIGALRAESSRAEVTRRVRGAWLFIAFLAIAAIGVAALVAWLLAGRLSAPLRRLASTATAIGDGDFTAREQPCGVAEIDTVATALASTAERLGAALARERSFSADASHQLRTPITALKVTLEAAALTHRLDEAVLRDAIAQADRLDHTVEELLALARDTHIERGPLDVRGLINELDHRDRRRLERDSGRGLIVAIPAHVPVVQASAAAVRQILTVLVDNAVEHGTGAVHVTVRALGDGLAIDVGDDGTAMSGNTEVVFARRSGDDPRRGIGLALARSLAEAEGGRLLLATTPHTVFSLVLARHA
jgi:signal transduction histidine kinase